MTGMDLLYALKKECEEEVGGLSLPTSIQSISDEGSLRVPQVHLMRLKTVSEYKKKVPYIIIQYINGKVNTGANEDNKVSVRFVFCVYDENEERGSLALLNLMQRIKLRLASNPIVGECFKLDGATGIEDIAYPDDSAPYFAGEMMASYILPPIRRSDI